MVQIRKGVFETNSSSTHSIVISKEPVKTLPKEKHFWAGEYGWEFDSYDASNYLFTAILCEPEVLRRQHLDTLKQMLNDMDVEAVFIYPSTHTYGEHTYYDCSIDHSYECADFVSAVLSDSDLLKRCVFGDATVYTGNDNEYAADAMCNAADDVVWDDNTKTFVPNPNYDPEHYDYFYKGN